MSGAKLTLQDLREAKGKRQLAEVLTIEPDEARACEAAGVDMLVTSQEHTRTIREAAPNTFLVSGLGIHDPEIVTAADAIRASFKAINDGADAIYTGMSVAVVAEMARESIPVVGHVGYVPYRSGYFGGPRAVGATANEAIQVYEDTRAYEDAGAIAVEMEIVPEAVASEISRRVSLSVISMGSGSGCDVQYLFACDILGTNTGHMPRHAKRYANLDQELRRIQDIRIDALQRFVEDVRGARFPEAGHKLEVDEAEFVEFSKLLNK